MNRASLDKGYGYERRVYVTDAQGRDQGAMRTVRVPEEQLEEDARALADPIGVLRLIDNSTPSDPLVTLVPVARVGRVTYRPHLSP